MVLISAELRAALVELSRHSLFASWIRPELILDADHWCNSINLSLLLKGPVVGEKVHGSFQRVPSWLHVGPSTVRVLKEIELISTIREMSLHRGEVYIKTYFLVELRVFFFLEEDAHWPSVEVVIVLLLELGFKEEFLILVFGSFFFQKSVCVCDLFSFSFEFLTEGVYNSSAFFLSFLLNLLLNFFEFLNFLFFFLLLISKASFKLIFLFNHNF